MKAQTIFNKGYIGVVKQGRASVRNQWEGDSKCMYRGSGGSACAVGHLLSDRTAKKYDNEYETGISSISDAGLLLKSLNPHLELLEAMQMAHDGAYRSTRDYPASFVAEFKQRMAGVAKLFNLTVPEIA